MTRNALALAHSRQLAATLQGVVDSAAPWMREDAEAACFAIMEAQDATGASDVAVSAAIRAERIDDLARARRAMAYRGGPLGRPTRTTAQDVWRAAGALRRRA